MAYKGNGEFITHYKLYPTDEWCVVPDTLDDYLFPIDQLQLKINEINTVTLIHQHTQKADRIFASCELKTSNGRVWSWTNGWRE